MPECQLSRKIRAIGVSYENDWNHRQPVRLYCL